MFWDPWETLFVGEDDARKNAQHCIGMLCKIQRPNLRARLGRLFGNAPRPRGDVFLVAVSRPMLDALRTAIMSRPASRFSRPNSSRRSGATTPMPSAGAASPLAGTHRGNLRLAGGDSAHSLSQLVTVLIQDCIDNPLFPPAPKGSSSSSHMCAVS